MLTRARRTNTFSWVVLQHDSVFLLFINPATNYRNQIEGRRKNKRQLVVVMHQLLLLVARLEGKAKKHTLGITLESGSTAISPYNIKASVRVDEVKTRWLSDWSLEKQTSEYYYNNKYIAISRIGIHLLLNFVRSREVSCIGCFCQWINNEGFQCLKPDEYGG